MARKCLSALCLAGDYVKGGKRPSLLIRRSKLMVYHKECQLKAAGDAKLVKDVREVMFHGMFANSKLFGDVFVGVTGDYSLDDI